MMSFGGEDEDGSFSKSELVPEMYASYTNGYVPSMTNQNPYASNR